MSRNWLFIATLTAMLGGLAQALEQPASTTTANRRQGKQHAANREGPAPDTQPPAPASAQPATSNHQLLPLPGRQSAAHARLFTPRGAPAGSYVVTELDVPMDKARPLVMCALGVADSGSPGHASWAVRRLEVGGVFGSSGIFEQTRLARLFNGRRALVARGPVSHGGSVAASVTLISPYPDATLSRLLPGTLAIMFDVRAARAR